jgi:hypothetical protein
MKLSEYDAVISLGSNCAPGLTLRDLCYKQKTYPFDWVRTNAKIIYDVLLNGFDNYLQFNGKVSNDFLLNNLHSYTNPHFSKSYVNYYGQHFTHYTDISVNELLTKFTRYAERFTELLNSNKHILFIHANEEFIYHKKARDAKYELYEYLCKINDVLTDKYPLLTFTILNIDIENDCKDYKNIVNINIDYDLGYSASCEYHTPYYYTKYRNGLTEILRRFL